ncbi:Cupin domain protein [Natronoarchaeum philippinense]|uniref:Cupin domain protein n=1 Tax=Natronoarchaeum philippinense TaxID=558529 RepID=A0A285N2A5_NATPI|nr:cupin domain-containing protein [Natronoarchaeum philippinense]SNZ03073.1 Cupin domain protein [Natronoarchaeum philippinense]
MGYEAAAPGDVGSVIGGDKGGMWFLREPLDTDSLGFTVLELEPDRSGKAHDHGEDGHEEIYYVTEGRVEVDVGADTLTLDEHEALRIDPEERRQIHNRGDDTARLVLVSAPTDEGAASTP